MMMITCVIGRRRGTKRGNTLDEAILYLSENETKFKQLQKKNYHLDVLLLICGGFPPHTIIDAKVLFVLSVLLVLFVLCDFEMGSLIKKNQDKNAIFAATGRRSVMDMLLHKSDKYILSV